MRKSLLDKKHLRKAVSVLRNEGVLAVSIKTLQKLQSLRSVKKGKTIFIEFVSLIDRQNVMRADWSKRYEWEKSGKMKRPPYTLNWVMSPPGSGGGHQNIFRFIEYTDSLGYENNVYIYSNIDDTTIAQARENVSAYCNAKRVKFYRYGKSKMLDSDVLFATGWETAYIVFNEETSAKKMYFVQDFEPFFYPIGTEYVLAENTYRFGFHGITAGRYLAEKLADGYGMKCDHYDFSADEKLYKYKNDHKRKEIFFYARPVTERRGFDLGIMALELFHERHPEYTINLAGWDISEYAVPFPYVNHGTLGIEELPSLYNRCAVALVVSLTNMSLLPLELLACGTIPVVNDGPNNRLVSSNPYISYTDASPVAMAMAMTQAVERNDLPEYSKKAAKSIDTRGWALAQQTFTEVLERELG